MIATTPRLRATVGSVLPLVSILAFAGCGSDSAPPSTSPGGASGAPSGTGGLPGGSAGNGTSGSGIAGSGTGGSGTAGSGTAGIAGSGIAGSGTAGSSTAGSGSAGTAGGGSAGTAGGGSAGSSAGGNGAAGGSTSGPVFHIFMLMGQSNMAGVAKSDAGDKNTDERLKIWGGCNQPAGKWNTANPPLNDCPGEKGWNLSDTVDPGIWFAKTLLPKLPAGDTIGLVGTAESGESINTFIAGGSHHAMILKKIAAVKGAPNARFAGVIFHQGESDSGQATWPAKVVQLYNEVKTAFGVSYDVPFILGELPAGGCCSGHNTQVHLAAETLPMGSWVSQEGTKVMDQYHFDHASVILMGKRYGEKMITELKW